MKRKIAGCHVKIVFHSNFPEKTIFMNGALIAHIRKSGVLNIVAKKKLTELQSKILIILCGQLVVAYRNGKLIRRIKEGV